MQSEKMSPRLVARSLSLSLAVSPAPVWMDAVGARTEGGSAVQNHEKRRDAPCASVWSPLVGVGDCNRRAWGNKKIYRVSQKSANKEHNTSRADTTEALRLLWFKLSADDRRHVAPCLSLSLSLPPSLYLPFSPCLSLPLSLSCHSLPDPSLVHSSKAGWSVHVPTVSVILHTVLIRCASAHMTT